MFDENVESRGPIAIATRMIDYLVTWRIVSSLPIVSTPRHPIFTKIKFTARENRNGTDNSVIKHVTEHFENSTTIRARFPRRTTEHGCQPMCAYVERFQREKREERRGPEWNEERGKIIKRESTKDDLPATRWNNFPANTVATFKRQRMQRFSRHGERQKQREEDEKENRRFILGERKKKKRRKERSLEKIEKSLYTVFAVFTYVNAKNGKGKKQGKKKWNDRFRFRSNDRPNELSSAIITANITV